MRKEIGVISLFLSRGTPDHGLGIWTSGDAQCVDVSCVSAISSW